MQYQKTLPPLLVGVVIGVILNRLWNLGDLETIVTKQLIKTCTVHLPKHDTECACQKPIDLEAEKIVAAEELINRKANYDNPMLINVIKKYFIEYPRNQGKLRNIRQISKTAQATKVLEILKNKTDGFFVESGAFDGETTSNTLYLEHKMNWKGVLIEMDPGLYLQTKGKNRNALLINACISPEVHPMKVQIEEKIWTATLSVSRNSASNKNGTSVYCFPFFSFMLAVGQTDIDYFSLDIEGLELEVLKTIPFDRLNIKVLTVEYIHGKVNKQGYIDFMMSQGYHIHSELRKCQHFCGDLVFIKKSLLQNQ